ncbi:MAG: hypothetical protein R3F56_11155 [Planctomycetota bacterium]
MAGELGRSTRQRSAVEPGSIRAEAGAMAGERGRPARQRSAVEPGSIRCKAGAMGGDICRPPIKDMSSVDRKSMAESRIRAGW